MEPPEGPTESTLQRIEGFARTQYDSGFEQGYVSGFRTTRHALARRSLVYLMVGLVLGGSIMTLATVQGIFGQRTEAQDPITLGVERGEKYRPATDFAKTYTVAVVATTKAAISPRGAVLPGGSEHVGSGIIYSDFGHIVTNQHVIAGATRFHVIWQDRIYPAKLIGSDPNYDIAVLKMKAPGMVAAKLLDPEMKVYQSEEVLAIGAPFGLHHTVTQGVVSYVGRRAGEGGGIPYLQTDAAINSGNSGGPLVNLQGRVVGINTWKVSKRGTADGIGFAIPIEIVRKVADEIIARLDPDADVVVTNFDEGEPLESAFLGVSVDRKSMEVLSVVAGSGADLAGVMQGDVITGVGNQPLSSFDDLLAQIVGRVPGDEIHLQIKRGEETLTITVMLGSRS